MSRMPSSLSMATSDCSVAQLSGQAVDSRDSFRFGSRLSEDAGRHLHLGEAAGVATNSRGHVFVYTRTGNPTAGLGNSRLFTHGGSRLFEFDRNGAFRAGNRSGPVCLPVCARCARRCAGQHLDCGRGRQPDRQVQPRRAGPDDPWPEAGSDLHPHPPAAADRSRPPAVAAPRRRSGGPAINSFDRATSRSMEQATSSLPTVTAANARIAKFDQQRPLSSVVGIGGAEPGQFDTPHSIATDAQGNVYVADSREQTHSGVRRQRRVAVANHQRRRAAALCISPGSHQYLYSSHTGDPTAWTTPRFTSWSSTAASSAGSAAPESS